MKCLQFFWIIVLFGTSTAYSQNQPQATAGFDIGTGFNNNSTAPSVLYHEELSLHKLPWLRVGLGIRGWGYYSGSANLYSQKNSVPMDTLKYRNISATGLSFVIGANVRVWKIDIGVNTDLGGFAFGSKRKGFYSKNPSVQGDGAAYYNKFVSTSPVIFNFLPLAFAKNSGQSEIYARIWVTRKLGVKLGYVYGRVTYLTREVNSKKVYLDNRQRHFSETYGMPYAALTFPLL
ncbi:hypothetical protein [Dyadobacter sp. NIV53]|uniref:hypothetical protein n=1 Tax=Dyadobacter sp. NIV53 TaxID=2861765 RepID=UPI001C84CB13|nr:hypothetical protein [Dyadobacter sp. NIV53]